MKPATGLTFIGIIDGTNRSRAKSRLLGIADAGHAGAAAAVVLLGLVGVVFADPAAALSDSARSQNASPRSFVSNGSRRSAYHPKV